MNLRVLLVAFALLMALPSLSEASVIPKLTFHQLYERADRVVHGWVIDQHSQWEEYDGNRLIFTYSTIAVASTLKEAAPLRGTIVVRTVGGRIDGYNQTLVGEATLSVNEEVVLFLEDREEWTVPAIVGFYQGKYRVKRDSAGNAVTVTRHRGQLPGATPQPDLDLPIATFMSYLIAAQSEIAERGEEATALVPMVDPARVRSAGKRLLDVANVLRGDLNSDGHVTRQDVMILISQWGSDNSCSTLLSASFGRSGRAKIEGWVEIRR